MKIKVFCLIVVAMLLCSAALYAGGDERIGTSGAQELRIPVGSRMSSLAGAGVADAVGAEAMYWNPAGITNINGFSLAVTNGVVVEVKKEPGKSRLIEAIPEISDVAL